MAGSRQLLEEFQIVRCGGLHAREGADHIIWWALQYGCVRVFGAKVGERVLQALEGAVSVYDMFVYVYRVAAGALELRCRPGVLV
jgi:hypothetical protein